MATSEKMKRIIKKIISVYRNYVMKYPPFPKPKLLGEEDTSHLLEMGDYSYGDPKIIYFGGDKGKVIIGKFCSIGANVKIFVGGEHNTDWITTYPIRVKFNLEGKFTNGHPKSKGDVIIGNDVWIGTDVIILSGVKIGNGAVIGAKSLVYSNIEPYTVVSGNPCKVIRKRFTDDEIEKLLKIKWWDWEISKILENVDLLCQNDITLFLNKISN